MLNLVSLMFLREITEVLKILLFTVISILAIDRFVPREIITNDAIAQIMIGGSLFSPYLWKGDFSANLNWILLTPLGRKKIFWSHALVNIFGLTTFFSLTLGIFYFFPYFSDSKVAQWALGKRELGWKIFEGPLEGFHIGMAFILFAFLANEIFGLVNPAREKISLGQSSIVVKGSRKKWDDIFWFGVIVIGVPLVFYFKEYFFNQFFITFIFSFGIIVFLTIERNSKLLKIHKIPRRVYKALGIGLVVFTYGVSYLVSFRNIENASLGSEIFVSELGYLGRLVKRPADGKMARILEGPLTAKYITELTRHSIFKERKLHILQQLDLEAALETKSDFSQFKKILELYDFSSFSFKKIKIVASTGERLIKGGHCRSCIIKNMAYKMVARKFKKEEISEMLSGKNETLQAVGLIISRYDGDISHLVHLFNMTQVVPHEQAEELRTTISVLTGQWLSYVQLFSLNLELDKIVPRIWDCGNLDQLTSGDWPPIKGAKLAWAHFCIREKVKRKKYLDVLELERCPFFKRVRPYCSPGLLRKYFKPPVSGA